MCSESKLPLQGSEVLRMREANGRAVQRNYIGQQATDGAERARNRAGFSMLSRGS